MTRTRKILALVIVELGLLAASAAGAVYVYRGREVVPLRGQLDSCRKVGEILQALGMLIEAVVYLAQGAPHLAFANLTGAQLAVQRAGLKLDAEFDEVQGMLMTPSPQLQQVSRKLLRLAERISAPPGTPPPAEPEKDAPSPSGAAPGPAVPPPIPLPPPAPAGGAARGAPAQASPAARAKDALNAPAHPPAAVPAAPPAPASASGAPPGIVRPGTVPERALDEGYRSILDAKTALVAGGSEAAQAIAKLARARVMMDEAGRTDLDEDLDAAITALRHRDDGKARAAIEAVLRKLR